MSAVSGRPELAARALRAVYVMVGAAVALVAVGWRAVARGERAERLAQRTGRWPGRRGAGPWVWIHAASVGEAELGLALAQALAARHPHLGFVVSSTTISGRARVAAERPAESRYFPIDFAPFLRRIVALDPPRLFVAVETEIWPEAWRVLQRAGVPVAVANARLSDRSVARYRWLAPLLRPVLTRVARVCARDPGSARRWAALGVPEPAVGVTGNLKFDLALRGQGTGTQRLFVANVARPVLLAASTHAGEDAVVFDAFARVRGEVPDAVLLLVPRHPPRAATVAAEGVAAGFAVRLWSGIAAPGRDAAGDPAPQWPGGVDVVVLDRLGLLRRAYGGAAAAFVGGSLVAGPGGHNLLEALATGGRVAAGPLLGNVEDQAEVLREAGALVIVKDARELSKFWLQALADPQENRRIASAASGRVRACSGALERTVEALEPLLAQRPGAPR